MELDDGAEAVGGLHRLNAQLPYADSIPAENERLLAEVKDALDRFTAQSDFKLLLQACSGMSKAHACCPARAWDVCVCVTCKPVQQQQNSDPAAHPPRPQRFGATAVLTLLRP